MEDIAMAEREAAYERGILNGVKFLKVKDAGKDVMYHLNSCSRIIL